MCDAIQMRGSGVRLVPVAWLDDSDERSRCRARLEQRGVTRVTRMTRMARVKMSRMSLRPRVKVSRMTRTCGSRLACVGRSRA